MDGFPNKQYRKVVMKTRVEEALNSESLNFSVSSAFNYGSEKFILSELQFLSCNLNKVEYTSGVLMAPSNLSGPV